MNISDLEISYEEDGRTEEFQPQTRKRKNDDLEILGLESHPKTEEEISRAFRKAALYRSPPPDPLIRTRALELAIAIAEENGLIDSARYYTEQLLQFCDSSQKEALTLSLRRLEATEL
jgi:hypothetical protein